MSLTDGATKKSLFIQVAWNNVNAVIEQAEHVLADHKDRTKDDYIFNLVLDEIGNEYGLHHYVLDALNPYLPGGHRRTFDNVFVGSHFMKTVSNPYGYGMKVSSHRWANLRIPKTLWLEFTRRYPYTPFHFYLQHEGVLDYWDIPPIRAGYEAFLIQSVRDAESVRPGRAVLWSPAVWGGVPFSYWERREIKRTFLRIRSASNGRGINWLHLQDMMGRGRADVTVEDVRSWYRALKRMRLFDSLAVNMEHFTRAPGYYGPEEAKVIQEREDWYQRHGVVLGASWEARQWMPTHKDL